MNTEPEHDEPTDPNPAEIPTEAERYPDGGEHPGAPTAEELAADGNLYPPAEVGDDDAVDEHGDDPRVVLHGDDV